MLSRRGRTAVAACLPYYVLLANVSSNFWGYVKPVGLNLSTHDYTIEVVHLIQQKMKLVERSNKLWTFCWIQKRQERKWRVSETLTVNGSRFLTVKWMFIHSESLLHWSLHEPSNLCGKLREQRLSLRMCCRICWEALWNRYFRD